MLLLTVLIIFPVVVWIGLYEMKNRLAQVHHPSWSKPPKYSSGSGQCGWRLLKKVCSRDSDGHIVFSTSSYIASELEQT